jgi:hypothetical protein
VDLVVTLVLEASGRDLRVPGGTYAVEPLDDDLELADAAVDRGEAIVLRRITESADVVIDDLHIVLPVAGPWVILDVAGELRGVRAREVRGGWFVALRPATALDALPTTFVLGDGASWHGDGWQLRPHPYVEPGGRDWRWRGTYSDGPHSLTIAVDHRELFRFWAGCEPVCGREEDDNFLGVTSPREFTLVGDRFSSWRDIDVDPAIDAFDYGVLLALARGAAGHIRWWRAMEHARETPYGMGDDGDSLADYLLGDRTRVDAAQRRLLEPRIIDATAARTADDVARVIAAGLGAAPADAIDDARLDDWLARRPLAELPRYVRLSVPAPGDLCERLRGAQPFIVWRLSGR